MLDKKNHSKYYCLYSFLIASVCMFVIFAYTGLLSTGEFCIIGGDLRDNYIPAIRNLCRDIMSGQNIFYTWTYGMGINTSLYNAYYAYSPLNIIYLLFYNGDMNAVTVAYILIKVGLSALCFQVFISKGYGVKGFESVVFAVFYSLCSYQIAFNVQNIIWLDAMIALPVIFMLIRKLFDGGKWIYLSLAYAFIFISQFYMGYMIGVASFIYFIICMFVYDVQVENRFKLMLKYAVSVLLAVGLSAWVWVPTLFFMAELRSHGMASFSSLNKNVLDIVNQLFWGEVSGYDALFPYIYCGLPTAVLSIVYFADRKNAIKERIGYGVMLFIMLISCIIMPIYAAWHGFDEPNSYEYRFSFIISFILCTVAAIEAGKANKIKKGIWGIISGALMLIYVIEMFWQRSWVSENLQSNNWVGFGINLFFMFCWCGILLLVSGREDKKRLAVIMLVLLLCVETVSNGVHIFMNGDKISQRMTNDAYYTWDICQKWAVDKLKDDNDFYRVNFNGDISASSGSNYGYNTVSYFSTADNSLMRNVLGVLGVWQTPRVVENFGLTDVTKMLFDIKYDAYSDKEVLLVDGSIGYTVALEPVENVLGIGYMVAGKPEDYSNLSNNAFENNNDLLSLMAGEKVEAFKPVGGEKISLSGNGLNLSIEDGLYVIDYVPEAVQNAQDVNLIFTIDTDEDVYTYVSNTRPVFNYDSYVLSGGDENRSIRYGRLSMSYIKKLEKANGGRELVITSDGYLGKEYFEDIFFYTLDKDEVVKACHKLSNELFEVEDYADGYIKGNVKVIGDSTLLFTSIPYEKGWNAYVNGQKYEISTVLYDSLIALDLPGRGEYEIELRFEAPGAKAGVIVSVVCLIIMVIICFVAVKFDGQRETNELDRQKEIKNSDSDEMVEEA